MIDSDETFALDLLEAECVALVHGGAFGLSPELPHLLRDLDRVPGRRLRAHPALLREPDLSFATSAAALPGM